jgi:hypothetical protein
MEKSHQGSISPTFYEHFLRMQIPKAFGLLVFFACSKANRKILVKSAPVLNFINALRSAFTLADPENVKSY